MLSPQDTPSFVMYEDLRNFGGIMYVDAARVLLTSRVTAGGKSPRERVEGRAGATYLSRKVVHVQPADVDPTIFSGFAESSQTICSRVTSHIKDDRNAGATAHHYSTGAAETMAQALDAFHCGGQVYRNEVQRLRRVALRTERDRAVLLVMLFCASGCLADATAAVRVVEEFSQDKLSWNLNTVTASGATGVSMEPEGDPYPHIGLLRLVNGVRVPPLITLNPTGSLVGTLVQGPGMVNNVDVDVSRRHLKIWREGDRWLCQGMNSTNGTTLIPHGSSTAVVVEPPRNRRQPRAIYPPQELHDGDILCLGKTTRFQVLLVGA